MRHIFFALLVVCVLSAFFLGYAANITIQPKNSLPTKPSVSNSFPENPTAQKAAVVEPVSDSIVVKMKLPAVDKEGAGQLAEFIIEARTGKGRVFIGFDDSPLINSDTQTSLRIALDVARRYAKADTRGVDVSYTFSTQSDVVGGKSAGAAASIGTLAAFEKAKLREDVLITGTVEPDGTIGPVGKIMEKAKAAKKAGFRTILVPVGEGTANVAVEECKESRSERSYVKECHSIIQKVDISKEVGINVVEVQDVPTAFKLFKAGT
ncbi:MAG TPA: S16 family serine protease [Candidatus Norongarragalinales archaeon]|nr:S16 family serine protease [Candidatus Norongarragalinales archaeon]